MNAKNFIKRPPRIRHDLPHVEKRIPNPPELEENSNHTLIQLIRPLLMIMGYLVVSMLGQGSSRMSFLLIPMGLSTLGTIGYSLYNLRMRKNELENRKSMYQDKISSLRQEMLDSHSRQRRFYTYDFPDPTTCFDIANQANLSFVQDSNETSLEIGTRLWEKRPDDLDFGSVRLGIGTQKSHVMLKAPDSDNQNSPLVRDANRLSNDAQFVKDIPIIIPLRPYKNEDGQPTETEDSKHAVGITGSDSEIIRAFTKSIITHFSTFHAPDDAQVFVLGPQSSRNNWRWLYPLPHSKSNRFSNIFFEGPNDYLDDNKSNTKEFFTNLQQILEERNLRLKDNNQSPEQIKLPFLLVIIDLCDSLHEQSRLNNLEMNSVISTLLHEGSRLGASIFFLVSEKQNIPSGCKAIIEVTKPQLDSNYDNSEIIFRYSEIGINTQKYIGLADCIFDNQQVMDFAKDLEHLAIQKSYASSLPDTVDLMGMFGMDNIEELHQFVQANWKASTEDARADWLRVPLGMRSGGEIRSLKLSAMGDGVHGLIAGSTGSGKSELLMTLILSLSIHYDPSIVNFVLVDFKGGGAFDPFKELPHCVDLVTNLDEAGVDRMFTAINAELERRQEINTLTESKDIIHYRNKNLHITDQPYPHLFIIIDEFAEMISENPEYKKQLERITRVGRSLGVSLILAAQRPSGVTDQMRANIKFKICLRVETKEESSEILGQSDAAYLPNSIPGRGYLQIGYDNLEMIQVAYSGADYLDPQFRTNVPQVVWTQTEGNRKVSIESEKLFERIVSELRKWAGTYSSPQFKPWPDPLPERFSFQTLINSYYFDDSLTEMLKAKEQNKNSAGKIELADGKQQVSQLKLNSNVEGWISGESQWEDAKWNENTLAPLVGIIDNPFQAEQKPLEVNFNRGHSIVFSSSGWGKSTFINSTVISLVSTYSPKELHIYALDFGGRSLAHLKKLPHMGAIIMPDEEERVNRFFRLLESWLDERKQTISEQENVKDLISYNQANQKPIPAILVVIDNFAEFKESFEHLNSTLLSIMRESRAYGIHFLISADQSSSVNNKIFGLLSERFVLKMSSSEEYINIVGRGGGVLNELPGRGMAKFEQNVLQFQVALPSGGLGAHIESFNDEANLTNKLIENMSTYWQKQRGESPIPIDTLPLNVSLDELINKEKGLKQQTIYPYFGIDELSLNPWGLDFKESGPHIRIKGLPDTGLPLLHSIVFSLSISYSPDQVGIILIDTQEELFAPNKGRNLIELPHVVQTASRLEQLCNLERHLNIICPNMNDEQSLYIIINNYDAFTEEISSKRPLLSGFAKLARDYSRKGVHFIVTGYMGNDALLKQIQMSGAGIALQTASAIESLGGRAPRGMGELPINRGFFVKSGMSQLIQFASILKETQTYAESFNQWISEVKKSYPDDKPDWFQLEHIFDPLSDKLKGKIDEMNADDEELESGELEQVEKIRQLLQKKSTEELLSKAKPETIVYLALNNEDPFTQRLLGLSE